MRAVRRYLDCTAAHHPRCERLFVTAGHSKKEISKTTVSFWLQKTISRAYELSGTDLPVPAPRARETHGIAPSLLFKKNFAVEGGYVAQAYHLYVSLFEGPCPSVPRHLPPWPCGGGTGLGLTLACSPEHSTLNDSGLTLDNSILYLSPSIHQRLVWAVVFDGKCMSPHSYVL